MPQTKTTDVATTTTTAAAPVATAAPAASAEKPSVRLGSLVTVVVAEGLDLVNNETGELFVAKAPTPQTVTVATLRRLQDGDLALV